MPTQEIPPEKWLGFFDQFSRQHEGWRANLDVLGSVAVAGTEARDSPLVGISADLKDCERSISIILGEAGQRHLTHVVSDPKYVRLQQTGEGADEGLCIESSGGVTTVLHFRSANRPETLNGVLQ